jgi:replicative DNA helicase
MNNELLFQRFKGISELKNPFDQLCALKQFKKEYKHSDFYKSTRLSIYKTYELFCKTQYTTLIATIQELLSEDQLSEFINGVFETIHLDVLINNMLRSINYDQLAELIQDLIPDLDIKQIEQITQQLKELTQK